MLRKAPSKTTRSAKRGRNRLLFIPKKSSKVHLLAATSVPNFLSKAASWNSQTPKKHSTEISLQFYGCYSIPENQRANFFCLLLQFSTVCHPKFRAPPKFHPLKWGFERGIYTKIFTLIWGPTCKYICFLILNLILSLHIIYWADIPNNHWLIRILKNFKGFFLAGSTCNYSMCFLRWIHV